MKKYILMLCMLVASITYSTAQVVVVHFGAPHHTEYYEYRHIHECPPPPLRAPRYYYAPRPEQPYIHHDRHFRGGPRQIHRR